MYILPAALSYQDDIDKRYIKNGQIPAHVPYFPPFSSLACTFKILWSIRLC